MEQKTTISFGIRKKPEQKETKRIILDRSVIEEKEETELVYSFEGDVVKSSKPEVYRQGALIIPLIKVNKWNSKIEQHAQYLNDNNEDDVTRTKSQPKKPLIIGDDIDSIAARELLTEAQTANEGTDNATDNGISIPLLMRNKIPEGFETDEKLDVVLRPNEAKQADYEAVNIEDFGKAILRGMGWKDGEGIGTKKLDPFLPSEAVCRPKGLGLGADRSQSSKNKDKKGTNSKSEKKLIMKKGTNCVVIKGQYKDRYGLIEGIDEDNARVFIKLTIGQKNTSLCQSYIRLVDQKEFDKYSKYLNKGKSDEYKMKQLKENERISEEQKVNHKDKGRDSSQDNLNDEFDQRNISEHKRNLHSEDEGHYKKMKYSSDSPHVKKTCWLYPNLQVRIIDKTYKKSRYYKTKVIIEDVVNDRTCLCRTDDNKILEDVSQNMVETVIPKNDHSCVMVVSGKYRGQLAELIGRNKSNYMADIVLLRERDITLSLDFDSICSYIKSDNFDIDD